MVNIDPIDRQSSLSSDQQVMQDVLTACYSGHINEIISIYISGFYIKSDVLGYQM